MNLKEYFQQPGSLTVEQLTKAIGVKHSMTVRSWQHSYANRKPGPQYCIAIERETSGQVTRQDLRPKDFHLIWPELQKEGA